MNRPDGLSQPGSLKAGLIPIFASTLTSHAKQAEILTESGFDWEGFRKHGIDESMVQYAMNRVLDRTKVGPEYVNPHLLSTAMVKPRCLVDNIMVDSGENLAAWTCIVTCLEEISNIVMKRDASLFIVAIPSTVQVDQSHYDFYRRCGFLIDDLLLDSTRPQDFPKEFCDRHDICFVDLLADLRAFGNTRQRYWENEDHLSKIGNQLVYRTAYRRVLSRWVRD
jgi:hypothetical protein